MNMKITNAIINRIGVRHELKGAWLPKNRTGKIIKRVLNGEWSTFYHFYWRSYFKKIKNYSY